MDDETAIAFASHEFVGRHPQETLPEWLARCTTVSIGKDAQRRLLVCFCVTPLSTNSSVGYFTVAIDPNTAETTVLLDCDLSEFVGETLQGFVPLTGYPWATPPVASK